MEEQIFTIVGILKLGIEIVGAFFVGIGCLISIYIYLKGILTNNKNSFLEIRLNLAKYLVLALEFQLGADILATAISPSWDTIGKLGAIAVIRTVLNYFLTKELKINGEEIKNEKKTI